MTATAVAISRSSVARQHKQLQQKGTQIRIQALEVQISMEKKLVEKKNLPETSCIVIKLNIRETSVDLLYDPGSTYTTLTREAYDSLNLSHL